MVEEKSERDNSKLKLRRGRSLPRRKIKNPRNTRNNGGTYNEARAREHTQRQGSGGPNNRQ